MHRTQKAQGDLLFIPVATLPRTTRPATPEHGRYILARGEATGHHHSVLAVPAVRAVVRDDVMYLAVEELTEVQHQEHAPVTLEPGSWEVRRQREYDWDDDEIRQVAD